uniref:RAN binding protein 1 n=1 Tax=Latimeria chalumnae TaxID=7897 RepID=H3BDF1_LATCH
IGSAFGLASLTLKLRFFQTTPCRTFIALSRSSWLLKVTNANVCFPNSFTLWGFSPYLLRNFFTSLKPIYLVCYCECGGRLSKETREDHDASTENTEDSNHDPHYEPIISLPEQDIKTLEEDEEELFKM